jgi:flavin-dependent dehydrogenase
MTGQTFGDTRVERSSHGASELTDDQYDVVIAGAGVAGLAAGIGLAGAGHRVVCFEPQRFPRRRVGESLDWSAPALLEELGLSSDEVVASRSGTPKNALAAMSLEHQRLEGRPPAWVKRWPLRFEASTLHVDRWKFDAVLYELASEAGVEFVWDGLESIVLSNDRVVECRSRSGRRVAGRWFLDASGRARLLARSASIGRKHYGQARIGLWTEVEAPMREETTTLYLDDGPDQLSWIWEIPIAADRQSLGVVLPLERFRKQRTDGSSIEEILVRELHRHKAFRDLPPDALGRVETRTFRSYVHERTVGANWLMIGEAAALVDPLTSLGVTCALRHASEAVQVIGRRTGDDEARALAAYDRRVRRVAALYNGSIDALMYSPAVRQSMGLRSAARAYVILGYAVNSLYSRIRPTTRVRRAAMELVLRVFTLWTRTWLALARRRQDVGVGT